MKKYVAIIISILIIILLSITYLGSNVNKYNSNLKKLIKENYSIDNKLINVNKYNNYYILTTSDNIIVLNNKYQEIYKEDISKIKQTNNMSIIYKNNKLMYLEKEISKNKVVYKYYDPSNLELLKEITFRRQLWVKN